MRRIEADLAWLVASRPATRPGHPQTGTAEKSNGPTPPQTRSVSTAPRTAGQGSPNPPTEPGPPPGNLRHTMGLCRWCYDRVRNTGRLPTGEELERVTRLKKDAVRG